MRDLALFEWSGLIFTNDTSDARYHVSHFRQRRVSFLRIRDAAEILSQLKGHFWDVFSVECLIGKRRPILSINSGMHFPEQPSTGKCVPLWKLIVGRSFPLALFGKVHPVSRANSGMRFPVERPLGKHVPL